MNVRVERHNPPDDVNLTTRKRIHRSNILTASYTNVCARTPTPPMRRQEAGVAPRRRV